MQPQDSPVRWRELGAQVILRAELFVDLLAVVRNAVRAGVESYSIKKLEPIYGFERSTELSDANLALKSLQAGLELGDIGSISDYDKATVQGYNLDDCASTAALQDWLEEQRQSLIDQGIEVPRPPLKDDQEQEELSERQLAILDLIERLKDDVPVDTEERTPTGAMATRLSSGMALARRKIDMVGVLPPERTHR